jgi:hypothetical protein
MGPILADQPVLRRRDPDVAAAAAARTRWFARLGRLSGPDDLTGSVLSGGNRHNLNQCFPAARPLWI